MSESSKLIQKSQALREILKSARDPIYFIENYCKIQHGTRGLVPFKLYEYQKATIKNFLAYDYNIINKGRQLGLSTTTAAIITWLILFHKNKSVLIVSTKADVSKNLLKTIKLMLKNVPDWMYLADISVNQAHYLGLTNGSWIKSIARSDDAGRSEALSLLVIDEAAHIRDMDELWKGLASTVATGGKIMALSTPKGTDNWFCKFCKEAESGENGWHYQEIFWWENPEYASGIRDDVTVPGGKTSPWFERMTAGWTRQQIHQELLTSFLESGDTFIDSQTIKYYSEKSLDPVTRLGHENAWWIWKTFQSGTPYLICVDVAKGTADDYSAFHIIDCVEMEQVSEFKAKIPPDSLASFLKDEVAPAYGNPLIVVENNNLGLVTALALKNMGYQNLAYYDKHGGRLISKWEADSENISPGFTTDPGNRPLLLAKMEELLRKKCYKLYSKRLVNEFNSFIWSSSKIQAKKGRNDDLVMALAIGIWFRDIYIQNYVRKQGFSSLYNMFSVSVNKAPNFAEKPKKKEDIYQDDFVKMLITK